MKNAVKKIMAVKIKSKPRVKETSSNLVFVFKLKPMKIGRIGRIQGDNIEITPVKNEIMGIISI